MAIITPLKKIFNWQTASEKIPYNVYTAYITVDDNENMYASQVLENTIGAVTFETVTTGEWLIKLPYSVPRLKIVIPGFSDWYNGTNVAVSGIPPDKSLWFYTGFGIDNSEACTTGKCNTNCVGVAIVDQAGSSITWRTFFSSGLTGTTTSYPIEIRVYN